MIKRLFMIGSFLTFFFHAAPTSAVITVMGDLSDERNVSPGEIYTAAIVVRNLGEEQEEVKIFQTDYRFYSDGSNYYLEQQGSVPRSNAGWIIFSPKRVFIPPKEEMIINYTVKIPQQNSLKGSYWSVLMIEPIPKSSLESVRPERSVSITSVMRYAYQIVTNIQDTGERKLLFTESKLYKDGDKRIFQINIENTGERMLRPSVYVQLFDSQGKELGPFASEKQRIYPGTSVRHRLDLISVPRGTYKALIVADCGDEDIFGINYTLNIE